MVPKRGTVSPVGEGSVPTLLAYHQPRDTHYDPPLTTAPTDCSSGEQRGQQDTWPARTRYRMQQVMTATQTVVQALRSLLPLEPMGPVTGTDWLRRWRFRPLPPSGGGGRAHVRALGARARRARTRGRAGAPQLRRPWARKRARARARLLPTCLFQRVKEKEREEEAQHHAKVFEKGLRFRLKWKRRNQRKVV